MMTPLEWFAFVILPATLAVAALSVSRLFDFMHPIPSAAPTPGAPSASSTVRSERGGGQPLLPTLLQSGEVTIPGPPTITYEQVLRSAIEAYEAVGLRADAVRLGADAARALAGRYRSDLTVAEPTTEIERLSVNEAAKKLERTRAPVVVFQHANNGRINIVYRRPDGNVGWIDAEAELAPTLAESPAAPKR